MRFGSSFLLIAAVAVAGLPLAGCDSFDRAIGKTRVIPDEFQVVSNDPLAIPPDFALRPPRVGLGTQEQSPTEQAREAVFRAGDTNQGNVPASDDKLSAGEQDLLKQTGALNAPSDIRQTVDADPSTGVPFDRSLVDKLLFWSGPTTPPSNEVIDPAAEQSRLRLAESAAKPGTDATSPAPGAANGAGVPSFDRETKKSGWFSWLF